MPGLPNGYTARERHTKNSRADVGSLGVPEGVLVDTLKCSRSKVRTTS